MNSRRLISSPEAEDRHCVSSKLAHWGTAYDASRCPLRVIRDRDEPAESSHVRFSPKATEMLRRREMTRWAISGHFFALFDYFVRQRRQRRRNLQIHGFRGF